MFSSPFKVALKVLGPSGWFTPLGYILLIVLLISFAWASYKILHSLISSSINKFFAFILFIFATPFIALASILISATFSSAIPLEYLLSKPSHESGFIALWVGVTTLVISVTVVPLVMLFTYKPPELPSNETYTPFSEIPKKAKNAKNT